jgi:hypothetical protein
MARWINARLTLTAVKGVGWGQRENNLGGPCALQKVRPVIDAGCFHDG